MLQIKLKKGSEATLVTQLVQNISDAIEQRRLRIGAKLPSVRSLAQSHQVSTFTVAEAYAKLVSLGYLVARPRSGYAVANRQMLGSTRAEPQWEVPNLGASWLLTEVFADQSIPHKAGCGWLPKDWLNQSGLHDAIRSLTRVPTAQFSSYGSPYGYLPLREVISTRLNADSVACHATQIVLTHGATHALDLVVRTVLKPGDAVLVEDPCYCNLLHVLKAAGLHVIGVPRTVNGIDTDALEKTLKRQRFKAIFLNPVFQNPTGTILSAPCAFRVLQLAEHYGLWVIEDDIYREMAPPGVPLLAAMEGLNRVIHVSGFSKTIAPSLRVGYVVAAARVAKELASTKMAVGLTTSETAERLVHAVLTGGWYERHVNKLATRLRRQHALLAEDMPDDRFEVFHRPEGGLFVWAKPKGELEGCSARDIAAVALRSGIWLAPGTYFHPDNAQSPWIRFNVATSLSPEIWQFFRNLTRADLLDGKPAQDLARKPVRGRAVRAPARDFR